MVRSKTIWKDGEIFAEYERGELVYLNPKYQAPKRSEIVAAPYFMKDISEYKSPLDGQMITTRSQHRDHMREHGVIEVGNERMPTAKAEPKVDKELGHAIKRRLDEVRAMPQKQYDQQVQTQREAVKAQAAQHSKDVANA